MIGKAMTIAVLALFLMASQCLAFRGGTRGAFSVPNTFLMPDPPRNVTAIAGDGMATVSFDPPKSDGGHPITVYTVTSRPGKIKASGKQSPITVKGLTNGRTYTFTVTASNSVGTGLASEACNSVTPNAE
jgi:hypothetical protein